MINSKQAPIKMLLGTLFLSWTISAAAQNDEKTSSLFPPSASKEWVVEYADTFKKGSQPYELFNAINSFGFDLNSIVNRMGQPKQLYDRKVTNRHDSEMVNTLQTVVYDGLVIELLKTPKKTLVKRLYIKNCNISSPFEQYLCKPASDVISRLGKPTLQQPQEVIYTIQHGDMGSKPLRIGITDDKVSWIYLTNYID